MSFTEWVAVGGGASSPSNRIECGFKYQYEQNIAENYTTIRLQPTLKKTGSCTTYNNDAQTSYFTVDGTRYNISTRFNTSNMSTGVLYPLVNGTSSNCFWTTNGITYVEIVVPHNADGTKTISIYEYIKGEANSSIFKYSTLTTSIELPLISRISLSNNIIGESTVISIPFATSTSNVSLAYEFGTKTGTLTFTGNTYEWTIPANFAREIPTSIKGNLSLVATISGNTYGSVVEIKVNEEPPLVTSSNIVSTPIANYVVYGKSTITVTVRSAPNQYASVYPYLKINGVESIGANPCAMITVPQTTEIENVYTGIIEYGAIDGRGIKNTQTTELEVVPYQVLTVSSVEGEWDTDTNTCNVVVKGGVYQDSRINNSLSVNCNGTVNTVTISHTGYGSWETTFEISGDPSTNLNIAVIASDLLMEESYETVIPKAIPLLTWGEDFFNVNGRILQNGSPIGGGGSGEVVELYNGSTWYSTSSAKTLTNGKDCNFLYILAKIASGDTGQTALIVPVGILTTTTTETAINISNESYYIGYYFYTSGNNVLIKGRNKSSNASGGICKIYGIK